MYMRFRLGQDFFKYFIIYVITAAITNFWKKKRTSNWLCNRSLSPVNDSNFCASPEVLEHTASKNTESKDKPIILQDITIKPPNLQPKATENLACTASSTSPMQVEKKYLQKQNNDYVNLSSSILEDPFHTSGSEDSLYIPSDDEVRVTLFCGTANIKKFSIRQFCSIMAASILKNSKHAVILKSGKKCEVFKK